MSRDQEWRRVSAMAGVNENGLIVPPTGEAIDRSPNPHWRTRCGGNPCPWPEREHVVIVALAAGMTAKEIARALGISHWTVQDRIKTAKKAIGVHTSTGMVATALREGWIE